MHGTDGRKSMRSSLKCCGMHHFGSASETVASCADAALFEPNVTIVRVKEVGRKGAARRERARTGPHHCSLGTFPVMHFSAAKKSAQELLGWRRMKSRL